MGAGPIGTIYVATEGAITIERADGVRHVLHPGDSILIAEGEALAVRNDGDGAAAMILITPPATRSARRAASPGKHAGYRNDAAIPVRD